MLIHRNFGFVMRAEPKCLITWIQKMSLEPARDSHPSHCNQGSSNQAFSKRHNQGDRPNGYGSKRGQDVKIRDTE